MGILLPHINTRDCLEVCATIILKPAGLLYMYSVKNETLTRMGDGVIFAYIYIYIYIHY